MISTATRNSTDVFQQAMDSFETALSAGMKLHEESLQRCLAILRDAGSPLEWQRTAPVKVNEAIAAMQQHVDESIRFMHENVQETVDLMETGVQMHETDFDTSDEDRDAWAYALHGMRANSQIIRRANARVLESLNELTKEATRRVEVLR